MEMRHTDWLAHAQQIGLMLTNSTIFCKPLALLYCLNRAHKGKLDGLCFSPGCKLRLYIIHHVVGLYRWSKKYHFEFFYHITQSFLVLLHIFPVLLHSCAVLLPTFTMLLHT
jgi:hypothetical protein